MVLLLPGNAFAWGPSAHLQYGLQVFENLSLLPNELQVLFGYFKQQYLYGCISADIIVGKKFTAYRHHCHNWRVGMQLLKACKSEACRAFMLGYLSHLAADTVAHNLFVPLKVVEAYESPAKGHLYWELLFDNQLTDQRILDMFYSLAQNPFDAEDRFLQESLRPTLFSFQTNKRIFNGLLILQRLKQWQQLMENASGRNVKDLQQAEIDAYNQQSLNAILSFLIDRDQSRFLRIDPTGSEALQQSKKLAKQLRHDKTQKQIDGTTVDASKRLLQQRFEQCLAGAVST